MSFPIPEIPEMYPPADKPKRDTGLRLHHTDFKLIAEILESIDLSKQERHLLWKVKTIIHNMDMARLRKEEN